MNRKVLLILIVVVFLSLIFVVLNLVRGQDETKPQLVNIFNANTRIAALSQAASTDAHNYNVKVAAASLNATSTSDNFNLANYYQSRFNKKPEAVKPGKAGAADPLTVLKETAPADFDQKYRQLAQAELEDNLATMRALLAQTSSAQLKEILNTALSNQTAALEAL